MQAELFTDATALPDGLDYAPDFLTPDEEAALVAAIAALDLEPARYKDYVARRRIASFGHAYDFVTLRLGDAPPLPDFLLAVRERVAVWTQTPAARYAQALLTAYAPGTPIGWHRDAPDFESVVGISLGSACRLRLRPWPHVPRTGAHALELTLAPRSIYRLAGPARWHWQHHIPPTPRQRYSITLRTLATRKMPQAGADGAPADAIIGRR